MNLYDDLFALHYISMHEEKIKRLASMKKSAESGGGQERIEAQHSKGKLTARERISLLLDEGSFVELDKYVTHRSDDPTLTKFYGDGAVTGFGTVNGRQVFIFSFDFTVLGGSLGEMTSKKIAKAMDHAMKVGCPIIGIIDSGGARIQEGVMSLDGYGEIFFHNTMASLVIPQITASIGPCAGGAVYSPVMTDFVAIVETNDDPNRIDPKLINILPENPYQQYDMKEIIKSIVDNGDFFEVHELFAENILVGFARMGGRPIGIIANQPMYLAGALDINSSNKAARFIRFCDAFNISIVTLVDTPGYLPGTDQEHNGIIRHGSKLLFAYCEATVSKVTCIIGKAYGGAYIAMGSKNLRADINYAWPNAEIAVLGPEAAITITHRRELKNTPSAAEIKKKLAKEFRDKFANPYIAAEKGIIDVVIDPMETRPMIIQALNALANKKESRPWKKHGNINL